MKVDVIQINYSTDDNIGGAVITGTTVYSSLPAVLTPRRPSQASLEAGLETDTIYDFSCNATLRRGRVTIEERDEILVGWLWDVALYLEPDCNQSEQAIGLIEKRRRNKKKTPIIIGVFLLMCGKCFTLTRMDY
jgi:hypothetical protein